MTSEVETTADLLDQARAGDIGAQQRLFDRYLRILTRWARGRLPDTARDLSETDDLVQTTLLRAFRRVSSFRPQREGAFLAYLRTILLNAVREEIRRSARHPAGEPIEDDATGSSVVSRAAGPEAIVAYERSLEALTEAQREAVILRLEFGYSYQEIADAIQSPSPDAARMFVRRALRDLAKRL